MTMIGSGFAGAPLLIAGSLGHNAVSVVLTFRFNRSPMPQALHPMLRKDLFDRGTP